jgi:hypothetical protein
MPSSKSSKKRRKEELSKGNSDYTEIKKEPILFIVGRKNILKEIQRKQLRRY